MSSELVLRKNWCGSSESRLEAEGRVRGTASQYSRPKAEYGTASQYAALAVLAFFPKGKRSIERRTKLVIFRYRSVSRNLEGLRTIPLARSIAVFPIQSQNIATLPGLRSNFSRFHDF